MKTLILPNFILSDVIDDKQFYDKAINLLNESKNNKKLRVKSNIKGFQTFDLKDVFCATKIMQWSYDLINKELSPKSKLKLQLLNYWINENPKNAYNSLHNHPNSHISGVYYLEVPKYSGSIYFQDPNLTFNHIYSLFNDTHLQETVNVPSFKSLFLLFPSNLLHGVSVNTSDFSRISISFNLALI